MLVPQTITVDNRATAMNSKEFFWLVWAVNYQVLYHYGRSTWVTKGLAPPAHVVQLPEGVKPPVGAWNLILLDHSDQQGALGYHDDENGNEIPYAEVFVVDSREDGSQACAVASHEAIEMLVDPDVQHVRKVLDPTSQRYYIVEACDAVQGCDYDVGAPQGKHTGHMVSDFCLPSWWEIDLTYPAGPFSFRNSVHSPFELAPQGYISVAPENDPNNWSQIFGSQQDRLPKWASRLPRIHPELVR